MMNFIRIRKKLGNLLNRQFLNYPMILTTHVLYLILIWRKSENIFGFHQLANSVIIFDEIQSYKNSIWREIIEFLKSLSNYSI